MSKYYLLAGFLFFSSFFCSCKKKFLEIVPLGSIVAEKTTDYDLLLNSKDLYYSDNGGWQEAIPMGDELSAEEVFRRMSSVQMLRLFQWENIIYQPSDEQLSLPVAPQLTQLYVLNKVIAEAGNSKGGTESEKKALVAEARAARAYLHFHFLNYFCQPYNETTASSDPGFPIIDKADITRNNYARGTVKETYDFIMDDLISAANDLPLKPKIATRWSKPALEAFLGKVLVFAGKYSEALPHLTSAFNMIAANGSPVLYDYNTEMDAGGAFMPIDPTFGPAGGPGNNRNDLKESVLSKVFYSGPYTYNLFGNEGLLLSEEAEALFTPNDKRLLLYTNLNINGTPNANNLLRKYGVSYSRYGIELSELYLLSAECKARTGDLTGAVADIEVLRSHRIIPSEAPVPSGIAGNRELLIGFIIDERIREFAFEGYRWFDMRRLSVDPLFKGLSFRHVVYNEDNSTTIFTLNQPNRLVLRINPYILRRNPNMQDNP